MMARDEFSTQRTHVRGDATARHSPHRHFAWRVAHFSHNASHCVRFSLAAVVRQARHPECIRRSNDRRARSDGTRLACASAPLVLGHAARLARAASFSFARSNASASAGTLIGFAR